MSFRPFDESDQLITRPQNSQSTRKRTGHLFRDCTAEYIKPKNRSGWLAPCPTCKDDWAAMCAPKITAQGGPDWPAVQLRTPRPAGQPVVCENRWPSAPARELTPAEKIAKILAMR